MTGPSTIAHHHGLHERVAQLLARLVEAERHQHGNTDFHCDYCGYPPQRDPNDSRSPPERESGQPGPRTTETPGRVLQVPAAPGAAAKSGGDHCTHEHEWYPDGSCSCEPNCDCSDEDEREASR